jgi:signal transduction histidine kinase
MIDLPEQKKGFALLSDQDGQIKKVLHDNLGFTDGETVGKMFSTLVQKDNRSKAMNFLMEMKSRSIALNYQMNVWLEDNIKTLFFIGLNIVNDFVIIGAPDQEDAVEFTHHLQEINNEQANLVRKLIKENLHYRTQVNQNRDQSLEGLTQLNNEVINLQRELARKNAELERINEMKNRFLGMAVHDLRSPLANIQSFTQLLIEQSAELLPEKHQQFLNIIHSTTQYMLHLIEDLLEVSKLESGKLELNKENFDLVQFANSLIELNKPLALKKEIQLNLDSCFEKTEVYADSQKMQQVFNNLLNNAIKFSYPHTTITVSISHHNGFAKVSVTDQGPGIPPEMREEIFQPFKKGVAPKTNQEKGTGLGLPIVKRIVEGHKGQLWLESEVDKGSTFYFTIPLKKQV